MLTTREINNTGRPLLDAKGVAIAGAKVEFQLVENRVPTDSFDTISGERVISRKHEATTNVNGEFSINLWPTSRGENGVVYLCSIMGRPAFTAPLLAGETALSWFDFYGAGVDVAPAELSAFQAHLANAVIHHQHKNKAILDKFSESVAGNPLYAGQSMGGGGTESLTTMAALIASSGAITTPADADKFSFRDSVSGLFAHVTWANIKALFVPVSHIQSAHAPSNATAAGATGDTHAGVTGNPHGTTTINGQRDTRTDLSPADGTTATLNCTLGNAFKITSPDTGAGMDFTIALSNVPTGAVMFAIEVLIVVGTNIPTISLTGKGANVTLPTLTASRSNPWIISTWDNGTTLSVSEGDKF